MKKFLTVLFFTFFLLMFFPKSPSLKSDVGYAPYFKRDKQRYFKEFRKKIKEEPPLWMKEQIALDVPKKGVSLSALEATERLCWQKKIPYVHRYRFIKNQLYRHQNPVENNWAERKAEPLVRFELALKTLAALIPLPDIDFLVTHEDGTKDPFYLTENALLQAPLFGWAKQASTPHLILIPDWRSLSDWWHDDIRKLLEGKNFHGGKKPWEEKIAAAFWRGDLTERKYRTKIARLSLAFPQILNAGINNGLPNSDPLYKPRASYEAHLQYKYLPVINGVMCSYPGYQWRLLSDALVLKQNSEQIQWFYKAIHPYKHYIPVKEDLSDLITQITWAQNHDEMCQEIALNATQFVKKNLLFDDVYRYLYYVFIAYSKCQEAFPCSDSLSDWEVL